MKRNYDAGIKDSVIYFTGTEVEHTPAFGKKTLFVVGVQPIEEIEDQLSKVTMKGIDHIFFGANHSFTAISPEEWHSWETMIMHFLNKDYWCSLDIPISYAEEFHEGGLNEFDKFIPQLCLNMSYIKLWNYNTMIKLDDKDFKSTNPGVWTHSLHKLMDRTCFTDWDQYNSDKAIK
jgi:hypothetical protein